MTQLNLDDDVVRQIEELARRENRSISSVMRTLLKQYGSRSESEADPHRTWLHEMALLTESDLDSALSQLSPNLAERSRDILDGAFAADLIKRMSADDNA